MKARAEKAKHKAMYPLYHFRPVHKKKQGVADNTIPPNEDPVNKRKEKQPTTDEDERRCDAVAQLLLEGKKGEEEPRSGTRAPSGYGDRLPRV